MADATAAGADLYAKIQALDVNVTAMTTAITEADLPTLRVAHSLLYDEMLGDEPRRGTATRRQMVLTEIRRREAAL